MILQKMGENNMNFLKRLGAAALGIACAVGGFVAEFLNPIGLSIMVGGTLLASGASCMAGSATPLQAWATSVALPYIAANRLLGYAVYGTDKGLIGGLLGIQASNAEPERPQPGGLRRT